MVSKAVIKEIDKAIKEVWLQDIRKDYWNDYLDREDTLKCAIYFYLRKRLNKILKENNIRIFTEYTFPGLKKRADMVIVEIEPDTYPLDSAVIRFVALFELKFTRGRSIRTTAWVKNDFWKFKDYMSRGKLTDCQFYFATVYEEECEWLSWLDARSTNNWADGRVTELDSGRIDGEMLFEINSYNRLNKTLSGQAM